MLHAQTQWSKIHYVRLLGAARLLGTQEYFLFKRKSTTDWKNKAERVELEFLAITVKKKEDTHTDICTVVKNLNIYISSLYSVLLCNAKRPIQTLHRHRFSAFWLRSKCSICSYQLNIWYEDHVSSSILIWFLPGETRSVACNAGFTSWPCIAVSQGSAHFPINLLQKNWFLKSLWSLWWISSTESKVPKVFAS